VHGNSFWCFDSQSNLPTVTAEDFDFNIFANPQLLAKVAMENQHVSVRLAKIYFRS